MGLLDKLKGKNKDNKKDEKKESKEVVKTEEKTEEAPALQALNRPVENKAPSIDLVIHIESLPKSETFDRLTSTISDKREDGYELVSNSASEGYKGLTMDHILIFRLK